MDEFPEACVGGIELRQTEAVRSQDILSRVGYETTGDQVLISPKFDFCNRYDVFEGWSSVAVS